jgi:hypothetical protein
MKPKFHYDQPKARIFEQGQALRDAVVIGRDPDGQVVAWTNLDERTAQGLLAEATPATTG